MALFDGKGELVERYCTVHLRKGEDELATPADGYPVFETDFGKVCRIRSTRS